MTQRADLVIVGAGIVGLAHAYAAARRGLSVLAADRDCRANGASVRGFGFVDGHRPAGRRPRWRRAGAAGELWLEVGAAAGIEVVHRGLAVAVRRPEAEGVLSGLPRRPRWARGLRNAVAPRGAFARARACGGHSGRIVEPA
jgi:glycine/D-amino acid oxidase-like deaminating enzyme